MRNDVVTYVDGAKFWRFLTLRGNFWNKIVPKYPTLGSKFCHVCVLSFITKADFSLGVITKRIDKHFLAKSWSFGGNFNSSADSMYITIKIKKFMVQF
jgi:hypothetical protein